MDQSQYRPAPSADFVLPFDLPNIGMRGRFLRLDAVSTRALAVHPLPEGVQRILAEALGLSALLGSALKFEGRLSVQTKGDGPLNLLVTDYFAGGGLRGYARVDERRFAEAGKPGDFGALVGEGALAITIEREQLPTMLRLAAGPIYRSGAGHGWRAGALMVQAVPGAKSDDATSSDDWHRVALFMETLEDIELLDTELAAETVLWRLFHEDEVRVHPSQNLHFECSCDAERVRTVLRSYSASELKDLPDPDGVIRTRCEFCGTVYEFPLQTLGG